MKDLAMMKGKLRRIEEIAGSAITARKIYSEDAIMIDAFNKIIRTLKPLRDGLKKEIFEEELFQKSQLQ